MFHYPDENGRIDIKKEKLQHSEVSPKKLYRLSSASVKQKRYYLPYRSATFATWAKIGAATSEPCPAFSTSTAITTD